MRIKRLRDIERRAQDESGRSCWQTGRNGSEDQPADLGMFRGRRLIDKAVPGSPKGLE